MIADIARFIACDYAADRVPLPGGLMHDTDLFRLPTGLRVPQVYSLRAAKAEWEKPGVVTTGQSKPLVDGRE
ncbi:hypothetical protein [Streptomyces yerevanensis]|uniref:hypothetical protein n=1 Tax=Streptomyces yerevanensis TaxID=66378 RepID=UPI0005257168|nr:hypothetical protein [Streptomyces yerevanensis]